MDKSQYKAQIDDILKISIDHVYRSREVLEKEIAGHRMLTDILDAYTQAAEHFDQGKTRFIDDLLLREAKITIKDSATPYEYLMEITHFVSRLTDGNAMNLFERLNGRVS